MPPQRHIHIHGSGHLRHDPTWRWDMDGLDHDQYLFWVITEGQGKLVVGDDRYGLERGVCIVSPMRKPHHGRQAPDALLGIPWFVFEFVDGATGETVVPDAPVRQHRLLEHVDFVERLVERGVTAFLGPREQHWQAERWLEAALLEVETQDERPDLYGEQRDQYSLLEELATTIRSAPSVPYTLDSMARSMHYSPDHLVRLFKACFHTTPMEYVIRCRMEQARHLLLFTNQSVSSIAEQLGYSSVSYFSRQFSRRVGVSPMVYRRNPEAT